MKLQLDSHVFLWLLNDPELLGERTMALLRDTSNETWVSVVSIWELGLKYKKGKQPYSIRDLLEGAATSQTALLALEPSHLALFEKIELTHKDPFDMLLIAQSEAEGGLLLTADSQLLESTYTVSDARM